MTPRDWWPPVAPGRAGLARFLLVLDVLAVVLFAVLMSLGGAW